jgi:hypothetical protein
MNIRSRFFVWILILCAGFLFSRGAESQFWWQVKIYIAVKGQYASHVGGGGFDGHYSFNALVLGSLHEDDSDFIFVQAYEGVSDMKWQEHLYKEKANRQFDLAGKIKPEPNLNYVFRTGGQLSFDIEIEPAAVPYEKSFLAVPRQSLYLPESAGAEAVQVKTRYNRGVHSGSNQVVIAVQDLYDGEEINRVFQWKWQEGNASVRWQSGHDVELTLKILRLKKQNQ